MRPAWAPTLARPVGASSGRPAAAGRRSRSARTATSTASPRPWAPDGRRHRVPARRSGLPAGDLSIADGVGRCSIAVDAAGVVHVVPTCRASVQASPRAADRLAPGHRRRRLGYHLHRRPGARARRRRRAPDRLPPDRRRRVRPDRARPACRRLALRPQRSARWSDWRSLAVDADDGAARQGRQLGQAAIARMPRERRIGCSRRRPWRSTDHPDGP